MAINRNAMCCDRKHRAARAVVCAMAALVGACGERQKASMTPLRDQAQDPIEPQAVIYDTTVPRPVPTRDRFERWVYQRGADLRLVDRLVDDKTAVPPLGRSPLPPISYRAAIADGVTVLDDRDPFPDAPPLPPKTVSIRVGIAQSTYRTREKEEVLSAVQPFIDLVQREVNIRGEPELYDSAEQIYFGLLDGSEQMVISHVFDYLLVQSWFANHPDNGIVPLAWAQPARPRTTMIDREYRGIPGTSVEIVTAADSGYETFADLQGGRLALANNMYHAPGTFLTQMLGDIQHPLEREFFSRVTLRRYPKDAVIDVIKGKADAACVDQGTLGALNRFYGLDRKLKTLAVSPRFNVDVLYTSVNNLATHQTEIELTQRQLTTLDKDPEGQEVLFFFDIERWYNHRDGDLDVPRLNFAGFLTLIDHTPRDLKVLLDAAASVDRRTYDRYGDE